MFSVIFICTGNICRSPMGEGILRDRFERLERTNIAVSSMGIHAPPDRSASKEAIVVCSEQGIDISRHISRSLGFEELKAADLIYTMESFHRDFIKKFVPLVADRTFLLGSWPGKDKKGDDISDPMGGTLADYRKSFELISSHIDRVMPFLLAHFTGLVR